MCVCVCVICCRVEHAGVAAVPLTKHGATVVAVGYTLAPKGNAIVTLEQLLLTRLFLLRQLT